MAFKMKGNPYKMGSMATKSAMKMGKKSPMKAEGGPGKDLTEAEKKAAMDNAMGAAEKTTLSDATAEGMNKYFGGVNAGLADVKLAIRKSSATEGNSDYVKAMRATAKARYPGQFK
jgi:hypothetical protein